MPIAYIPTIVNIVLLIESYQVPRLPKPSVTISGLGLNLLELNFRIAEAGDSFQVFIGPVYYSINLNIVFYLLCSS